MITAAMRNGSELNERVPVSTRFMSPAYSRARTAASGITTRRLVGAFSSRDEGARVG